MKQETADEKFQKAFEELLKKHHRDVMSESIKRGIRRKKLLESNKKA